MLHFPLELLATNWFQNWIFLGDTSLQALKGSQNLRTNACIRMSEVDTGWKKLVVILFVPRNQVGFDRKQTVNKGHVLLVSRITFKLLQIPPPFATSNRLYNACLIRGQSVTRMNRSRKNFLTKCYCLQLVR